MKKAHKSLLAGGIVAALFGGIGTVVGKLFLDKRTAAKAIGPKIAGEDDDSGPGADLLKIDSEESEAFGLQCGHWVLVRQDSQGFVLVTVHESRDAAEARYHQWIGG